MHPFLLSLTYISSVTLQVSPLCMHYLIFPAYGLVPPVGRGNAPLTLPLPDVAGISRLDAQRCHLTTSFKDANRSCRIVCPRIFLDFSSTYPPFDNSGRHASCFVP